MDLRQVAQGAPYHLATSMAECPLGRFWVVQLDAGFDVFETADDPTLETPNAWLRLKQFCEDMNVKPTNMAYASNPLDPNTQINMDPLADAYFFSKRARRLLTASPLFAGYQDDARGVGQLHKNTLKIVWEFTDGRYQLEERALDAHPKSDGMQTLIYKA